MRRTAKHVGLAKSDPAHLRIRQWSGCNPRHRNAAHPRHRQITAVSTVERLITAMYLPDEPAGRSSLSPAAKRGPSGPVRKPIEPEGWFR